MAHIIADLVRETSTTTGTTDFALAGAVTGFRAFSAVCANSDTTYYRARIDGGAWEVGIGTWVTGNTLQRTTILASSTGSKISFAAGTKDIVLDAPAALLGINALTAKTTPVDADELSLWDSAASAVKKLSWANLKSTFVGKQMIPITASGMTSRTTNGAAAGSVEMTTNKNMFVTLDFDTSTQEFAQFVMPMPDLWNEGTVTFRPIWSHASTTTNFGVVWSLAAVAMSDDDAGDVAFGTAQTSTDTGGTTNDIYIGPESAAITVAGSPPAGDLVMFQVARVPANGSDTMAIDARLHAIKLYITTDAGHE
jgi:hypothetical protein